MFFRELFYGSRYFKFPRGTSQGALPKLCSLHLEELVFKNKQYLVNSLIGKERGAAEDAEEERT